MKYFGKVLLKGSYAGSQDATWLQKDVSGNLSTRSVLPE